MNTESLSQTQGDIDPAALPPVVERAAFQDQLDDLRVREKAHTRAGDEIAAARRRLGMVEVDGGSPLTGPNGPLTLLDAFEGRRQLIAYYHMWFDGQPARGSVRGLHVLQTGRFASSPIYTSRDITYATLCQGPYEESVRYRDFMGWTMPWYSAQESLQTLLIGP